MSYKIFAQCFITMITTGISFKKQKMGKTHSQSRENKQVNKKIFDSVEDRKCPHLCFFALKKCTKI